MADYDTIPEETKEGPKLRGRPKGSKSKLKAIEEAKREIVEEQRLGVYGSSAKPVLRDARGHLVQGSGTPNPGGRPKGIAAQIRAAIPDAPEIAAEIARGERKATREQVTMLLDCLNRGWGKPAETHLVGAMDPEHRDAVAGLSRDQLLGLLDAPRSAGAAPLATESTAQIVEGTVITSSTD